MQENLKRTFLLLLDDTLKAKVQARLQHCKRLFLSLSPGLGESRSALVIHPHVLRSSASASVPLQFGRALRT
ncbi:hypothetical protein LguiA_001921 [Lonicera macranthoides]